jgi:HNH endonuclease
MRVVGPCLIWGGYKNPKGYGRRRYRGRFWMAHRVAWVEAHGEIPEGMYVLHHCDNPPCINIEHLFLGTLADNNHDRDRKGRHWQKKKTHCPRGHAYDHVTAGGRRWCRQCDRDYSRRRYADSRG